LPNSYSCGTDSKSLAKPLARKSCCCPGLEKAFTAEKGDALQMPPTGFLEEKPQYVHLLA